MASVYGRVKMLTLPNKVNADLINQRTNCGVTPLLIARQFGHDDVAEWLLEHGAEEAGEPLEDANAELLEAIKVLYTLYTLYTLSQLVQMHSIISHKRPFISHISSSLYTVGWTRGGRGKGSIGSIGVKVLREPGLRGR
jgi:hypothetical protein